MSNFFEMEWNLKEKASWGLRFFLSLGTPTDFLGNLGLPRFEPCVKFTLLRAIYCFSMLLFFILNQDIALIYNVKKLTPYILFRLFIKFVSYCPFIS